MFQVALKQLFSRRFSESTYLGIVRTLRHAVMFFFTLNLLSAQAAEVGITPVVTGLIAPIGFTSIDDDSGRSLILDQSGVIHLLLPSGNVAERPFLDIRDRLLPLEEGFEERGLLGMAMHPQFASNGRLFVTYSAPLDAGAPAGWNYTRRVSEFHVGADRADPASERVLLKLNWPSRKHNGGALAFGPDGMLYIGFGDGGGIHGPGPKVLNDAYSVPNERLHWDGLAQNIHSWFGKILRIDVDPGYPGYASPADNPFVGQAGRDEIYAWGFRNPYRMAFDPNGNGSFFVTAVGETLWEAIYHVRASGNYGWPLHEGTHCFERTSPLSPPAQCAQNATNGDPIIHPVVEYPNMSVHREGSSVALAGVGTAVVGGIMNRHSPSPILNDKLLVADWSADFRRPSGQLFLATSNAEGVWPLEKLAELDTRIVALIQDIDHAIYVLTNENFGPYGKTGKVYRLEVAE